MKGPFATLALLSCAWSGRAAELQGTCSGSAAQCAVRELEAKGDAAENLNLLQQEKSRRLKNQLQVPLTSAAEVNVTGAASNQSWVQVNSTSLNGDPPIMDDVAAALNALSETGQVMEVSKGQNFPQGYDDYIPPYSTHFEGCQRLGPLSGASGMYLALTGHGKTASQFFVIEVASKSIVHVEEISTEFTHAGGPAGLGDVLIVPLEMPCDPFKSFFSPCVQHSKIMFYDVSTPTSPKFLYSIDRPNVPAGAVGILKQQNGKFLLIVGRADSAIIDFYVSGSADGNLKSDPAFKQIAQWQKSELLANPGLSANFESYQNLNLVLQKDGQIFMVGSVRTPLLVGRDYYDLFKLQPSGGGRVSITKVASRAMTSKKCDFYAGASIYVDSATKMNGYCVGWNPDMFSGLITINQF